MTGHHQSEVRCMWCVSGDEWARIESDHPGLVERLAARLDWEPTSALMFTLDVQEANEEDGR